MEQHLCPVCNRIVDETENDIVLINGFAFHNPCYKLGQQIMQLKHKNVRLYNEFSQRVEENKKQQRQ